MSLQWEPEWEEVIIEDHGIKLKVLRDKKTLLYACPICGLGDGASFFFNTKDLILHIAAHADRYEKYTVKPKSQFEILHSSRKEEQEE